MATFELKMPKLGESVTEGTIITWSVKQGDSIEEDDVLFEVTTAKVNAEVPSPVAGKILELLYKEGDTIPVGEVVALIALEGEEGDSADAASSTDTAAAPTATGSKPDEPAAQTPPAKEPTPSPTQQAAAGSDSVSSTPVGKNNRTVAQARWYSPLVLQMAKEAKLSQEVLDSIPGTGFQNRVTKEDLKNHLSGRKAVAPTTRKPLKPIFPPMPAVSAVQSPDGTPVVAGTERIDMDPVRRIIAERMVQSKHISAHVTTVVEADVTRLVLWRKHNKTTFEKREGLSLTYLPSIVEATARALADFPRLNSSVDGQTIVEKKFINMGIAVSLDNGNLVVPVIRNADKLNISGLAHAINELSVKARSNKLKMEDIEGGTFTITNFGSFRNLIGTPIINQPEVAILGVGYIEKKPAVIETPEGDVIGIRSKMYLSLTYDHRIIDGSLGGAFLRRIADYLEQWDTE